MNLEEVAGEVLGKIESTSERDITGWCGTHGTLSRLDATLARIPPL